MFTRLIVLLILSANLTVRLVGTEDPRDESVEDDRFFMELSSQELSSEPYKFPPNSRDRQDGRAKFLEQTFSSHNLGDSSARFRRSLVNESTTSSTTDDALQIQVTAIHVDESEFPLSKLLFKLTLRLALSEAMARLQSADTATALGKRQRLRLSVNARSANTCSRQYAGALAAEEFYMRKSHLFIVSGCDDAIRAVSRLASQWRVPVMTAAGFGADLNDKDVHKTLIRVAFSLRAAVEFLFKVMRSFQWHRVNMVVDESDTNSLALKDSVEQFAAKQASEGADFQLALNTISFDLNSLLGGGSDSKSDQGNVVQASGPKNKTNGGQKNGNWGERSVDNEDKWPNQMTETVVEDTLRQTSMFSRVTILLIPQQFVRRFMLSAYDQNMANGMYTFINMPLLPPASGGHAEGGGGWSAPASSPTANSSGLQQHRFIISTGENAFIWRSPRPRARNAHTKQAFESLMSIYLRTPTTKAYVYFASKLNNLANSLYGTATKKSARLAPSSDGETTDHLADRRIKLNIDPYSASFYDALQIYVTALNESLALWRRKQQQQQPGSNNSLALDQRELHARISEIVRNRRFENMVTGNVYINANGDRETDYTLDDMNQMTGKFAPVILYRGETRDIERLGRIHWSSDASVGPTSDMVDCALLGTCGGRPITRFTFLLLLLAGPLFFLLSGAFYFVHNKLSLESQLVDYWWRIHLSELEIVPARRKNANDGSLVMTTVSAAETGEGSHLSSSQGGKSPSKLLEGERDWLAITSPGRRSGACSIAGGNKTVVTKVTDTSTGWASSAADACYGDITLAIYKLSKVALKPISKFHQSRKLMIELRNLKEVKHNNLCRFVGILVDEGNLALVSEFCAKGSLREFFHNESMVIDWTFKYSIINDIMAGLQYLHASPMVYHGRLKSSNCLVSGRFVVKLSDYGPHSLLEQLDEKLLSQSNGANDDKDDEWLRAHLWSAPEHLKSSARALGSMKGDVYSLGLLLYEIITSNLPFFDPETGKFLMPLEELHQTIKSKGPAELMEPIVSSLSASIQEVDIAPLVDLMRSCWRFEAGKRPSSQMVSTALKRITRGVTSKKLLENLTSRMEQYTNNLESLVEAKLATLMEEKLKTEELLYQFVPKSIASLLKEGQFVEPEAFECVTVFYSDIVGFTSLSSQSSPMEVVDFLSDLYLCFDETLEQRDIFKVDTIGDAYIVASGLPQRNDGKHVVEIACAALELRDRLKRFKIRHKPEHSLEMRVGIHSGPCIAGIVGGLNMPKYCVFGDTLTIGKFMESSGLPMKIHITEESRQLLRGVDGFCIEPRTPGITRDGLPFQTYWLEKRTAK